MIDIHMHVIPGVDDGSEDLDMSMEMLRSAHAQGVTGVIATPHGAAFYYGQQRVLTGYERLKTRAETELPEMKLGFGAEVRFTRDNSDVLIDMLKRGEMPTLNGTRYVLTEFQTHQYCDIMLNVVERISEAGYVPVIAHIERYVNLRHDDETLFAMRRKGALIQVNAFSLEGESHDGIRDCARRLLNMEFIDLLGSDAHRMWHRPPNVADGIGYVRQNCAAEYADRIIRRNAAELLGMGASDGIQ